MDKTFKIIITIAILIISFSVFYYYVIFLPHKEQVRIESEKQQQIVRDQEKYLEQQEKCRELGTKAYNDYKKNNSGVDYFFDPEFHFNKTSQTCIYSGGYYHGTYWERFVRNAYTDESIILTWNDTSKPTDEKQSKYIEDFWNTYKELFER